VRRHIHYMQWLYIVFMKKFYLVLFFVLALTSLRFASVASLRLRLATRTGTSAACLQISPGLVWLQLWLHWMWA